MRKGQFKPGQVAINRIVPNAGNRSILAPNRKAQTLTPAGILVFNPRIPDMTVEAGSVSAVVLFEAGVLWNWDKDLGSAQFDEVGTWPDLTTVNTATGQIRSQAPEGAEGVYTGLKVAATLGIRAVESNEFTITVLPKP